METPLLKSGAERGYGGEGGDYPPLTTWREVRSMLWRETVKVWRVAGPLAFQILCQFGTNLVTTVFVGHIGNLELSAVSISVSVIGTFSFGFMLGMGSALETLCGQAYGAGQVQLLGVYLQRSWIILLVSCIILLPIYIFATPILKALGQEDEIADLAGQFTLETIPQLFSLAIIFPTQKFLQAQSKVNVQATICFVALILDIGMLAVFIFVFGWGTTGAAIAYDISSWVTAVAQVVYAISWCKEGWTGLTWSAFREIWAFVRLSLASAVMLCLEIWYFMIIILLTGHLQNAVIAVGSLSICMTFGGLEVVMFMGMNAAVSIRVSNELGYGHPRAAKYSVFVAVSQSLLIGIFCMVVVLLARDYIAIIFTTNKEMQEAVSHLAYLLGVTMLLNSLQPVFSGVAVGGGWQAMVAYINLGCYYIIGIPLGYLLGYKAKLGVQGLWGGMICGTALQTLVLLFIVYRTNWNREVEQTTERMQKWGGQRIEADDV
ncbi:protein TRANSPARENT TESTA 12-like [Vitis vinifera]|uniref:Protein DETOXIFICATION n=1 Tax=Vitis vinifera TaxID=29760 RepID=C0JLI5_VITVI|nr:protein TRANSPARENT TESTA 12-like [Vitis vinifera]ACN88706.1 putative anthocyanin permease [Vitis vinifera]|eukprot:NP_001268037.1 protein TRANSPARENT TESTA 12-like [Vitis vinifera]